MKKLLLLLLIGVSFHSLSFAQHEEESESPVSVGADMVSRFVWRGQLLGNSPSIQPYAEFSIGSFTLGTWGSYGFADACTELDLYLEYELGDFSFTLSDYYFEEDIVHMPNKYFVWNRANTGHSLEGMVAFNGTEKFPLSLTAATMFYGCDGDDFSTYIEVGYAFEYRRVGINLFVGGTPAAGIYADGPAVVNVGAGFCKSIRITDSFQLPISTTFSVNPADQQAFLVFKISL